MKIMAIGAHPDDIEIFMFGLLAKFKKLRYEISLIIATDGSLGGKEDPKRLAIKRKKETINALCDIGIPVFLDLPDGYLGSDPNHFNSIRNIINKIKPDLIITHSNIDYHSDHRVLSNYISDASGHYFPIIYCDTLMGINFNPNYYIDVTDVFNEKIRAILKHKTQKPQRFVETVKLMNSYRSAQCNSPLGTYAEAYSFERSFPFADLKDLLPPSPPLIPFNINNKNGFL